MLTRYLPDSKQILKFVFMLGFFSSHCLADPEPLMWAKTRLKMGFYSPSITEIASLSDIEVSMNFWVKDFIAVEARKRGIDVFESQAILFDHITDMHDALTRGELDIVIAPPLMLVKYFQRSELQDGFTGILQGRRPDNLLFIAREDKHVLGVKDLKGKRIAIHDNDEFAEMFLDSLFLEQFHQPVERVAHQLLKQTKGSRIVLDVFFGNVDAGVVYRNAFEVMAELNPDIAKKLVIIDQYPIKSRNFGYFASNYPYAKELTELAAEAFLGSARAKQILEVFKTPEIDSVAVSELDAYRQFYERYQALKKQVK